jgi:hypothetical protein
VHGARLRARERDPSSLEAILDHGLDLGPIRPRLDTPEAAERVHDAQHGFPFAIGIVARRLEPANGNLADARGPLRPRRLAAQVIEVFGELLHDAQAGVRGLGALALALGPLHVPLARGRVALLAGVCAEPRFPTVEAGDDARVARDLVPCRGIGGCGGAQQGLEANRSEGEELHHRRAEQPAATEEKQQRSRVPSTPERQRRVELEGNAQAIEEVGEERGVAFGARKDDAHFIEEDAAARLPEKPPHERAHFARLSGCGHELHRVVPDGGALRRLEQALAKPQQAGRKRLARRELGKHGLLPLDLGDAVLARPGPEGGRSQRGRLLSPQQPHPEASRDLGQELLLPLVELEIVDDQDLGPHEPRRSSEGARRRAEHRAVVDDLSLALRLEGAVEASESAEAVSILGRFARALRERLEPLWRDAGLPQIP